MNELQSISVDSLIAQAAGSALSPHGLVLSAGTAASALYRAATVEAGIPPVEKPPIVLVTAMGASGKTTNGAQSLG